MSETDAQKQCDCGCRGAGPLFTAFLNRLGSSETVSQHFQTAHLEVLKGIRALLDEQIAARSKPASQGAKISVE
jgi:hypothetical protein